uniref:Uncharacterized protein n=1 Tax=Aeromonas dhakensis TaxID=196024 RepID=A0A1L0AUH7_9GAMM|nr:Uncharacterised protein [Aeromonas dhakensis]
MDGMGGLRPSMILRLSMVQLDTLRLLKFLYS